MRYVRITITLVILVITVVLGFLTGNSLMHRSNSLNAAKAETTAAQIARWYDTQIATLEMLATTIEIRNMAEDENADIAAYLADALAAHPTVFDYYFCMEDTTCFFGGGWEPAPGEYDPTTRDWYKAAKASDETQISSAYVDAETGRMVMTLSKSVKKNGTVIGVMAADIFIDDVTQLAQDTFPDKKQYAIIVDSAGTVLTHKNEAFIPAVTESGDEQITTYQDAKISEKLIGQDKVVMRKKFDYDHVFRIFTADYLEDYGLTIIFVDDGLTFYNGVIVFFMGCILIFIISLIVISNSMNKVLKPMFAPLDELQVVADNMANGVLHYEAQHREQDEIGKLCLAIEKSNAAINAYIQDIGQKLYAMEQGDFTAHVDMEYIGDFAPLKVSINEIGAALRDAMHMIAESADNIYNSAQDVAGGATSLAEEVESVTRLVDDGNESITQVSQEFENSKQVAEGSLDYSEDANKQLEDGNTQMSALLAAMERINATSEQIVDIIETINDIASQTNLLALNASIEAARAGEAGKGFAVVADSVRDLAAKTAEAAVDTTKLIQESNQAVEEGSRLARETAANMTQIVESNANVHKHIRSIVSSIESETEIISSVSKNFYTISEHTMTNSATSEECVALSQELFNQVENMHNIIGKFKI